MQKSTIFPEIKTGWQICFFLLFCPLGLWSQLAVDFEDGFMPVDSGNQGWLTEQLPPERWRIDSLHPISGKYSLHHSYDNPDAGCDYFMIHHGLFRRSQPGDSIFTGDSLSFSFRIRHSYLPSSSNNWQLAILAGFDGAILEGIVLGVNLEGFDDMVRLWRVEDGDYEELCSSSLNYQEDVGNEAAPSFRLTWQWDGRLELRYATDFQSNMQLIASCVIHELPQGRSLVARYEYSAAQDRKLWLDDLHLEGCFLADTLPPRVSTWSVETGENVKLGFSESLGSLDSVWAVLSSANEQPGLFTTQEMAADSFSMEGENLFLYFPDQLPNREVMDLQLGGICDRDGNLMRDTVLCVMRNEALWGDMVINELMADPNPVVGVSLGEYVELFNRSEYMLNMDGWILVVGKRKYELGELGEEGQETRIAPGNYLLLTGLSLPNQGSLLALYDGADKLVHAAAYKIPYDAPQWKREGGWSLESPDPDRLCNISGLWEYSEDHSGGTPGALNSVDGVRPDYQLPVLLYFGYGEAGELWLYFSEQVNLDAVREGEVILSPGSFSALEVNGAGPLLETLICRFSVDPSLFSRFTLNMPAVPDCLGNLSRELSFNGGPALAPGPGSVHINEIMYDPAEGAVEYIELYNPGQSFVDLRDLALGLSTGGENPEKMLPFSQWSRIMGPGEYVVLSASVDKLRDAYGLEVSGCWVELEDFMALPDGGGQIWVTDRAGNGVDVVSYDDNMHMELISDTRGISLERIDQERAGSDPHNWHSAASAEAYATPGRLNSQAVRRMGQESGLVVEPGVFSPDNDGYRDLLEINPGVEEAGSVIRLWITTVEGRAVRSLANNHVAGVSSQYTWDGRDDSGGMAPGGFYVVHLRVYNPSTGSNRNRKAAIGLIYR